MHVEVLERRFTKFDEITPFNSIISSKVTDFGTDRRFIYGFVLVINTNFIILHILHRFQVMAHYWLNFR